MSDNAAVDRLNALVSKLVAAIRPPPNVTVSEWAAQNRVLSPEASAEQGRWRNSRTPYLVEIMDAYSDPRVHHIVVVASSQVGKSEFENNVIGRTIDVDPGSILFIHPVQTDAKEYSKLRIAPMIRDCPTLRAKVAESKSRDSGNTILQKSYPGGILTMCGSTEAHALASKPIRYVLGDERDRWAASAGTEGDPWELAMARQTTFYNAKAVEVSTPTIKGHSAIAKSYVKGTMERWVSQCPHCKGFHELRWEDIRYEYDTIEVHGEKTYKVNDVWYLCPECGCISDEVTMKRAPAHWQAENPAAYENGIRSFWLNSFVSQWAAWKETVLKYLNALGDTKKMQVVYNTRLGLLWEDRGDVQDEDTMLGRREEYPAELPDGVLVLTAGVDTQDDRMEYEIVGFGHFGETWGIEKGIIMGRPDSDEVWQQLDELITPAIAPEEAILLECITTMVTNLLFALGGDSDPDGWDYAAMERAIDDEIGVLIAACQRCPAHVVLVTNEVGMGIVPENRLARHFRDIAGRVNQRLAAAADAVWLVVSGIGVKIK